MDRKALRQELRERRSAAVKAQPAAAEALAQQFKKIILPANAICAGYVAIRDEIDPAPIMDYAADLCMELALPVVVDETSPLEFRAYEFGDFLPDDNAFKIPEPMSDKAVVMPNIILVPLLGFDRTGHRMGSGKGLYDRTLAHLRRQQAIIAIGVGFAEQEVDQIVAESHDQRLNIIVTPREVIYCPQS